MTFVPVLDKQMKSGTTSWGPVDVPTGTTQIAVLPDPNAADWDDPALTVTLDVEYSDDNEVSWRDWFGCSFNSATSVNPKTGLMSESRVHCAPTPAGRRARGVLIVSKNARVGLLVEII